MKVPFFRYPYVFEQDRTAVEEAMRSVCSRGAFILQRDLVEFEEALAEFCGLPHAVGVGNATDGLELIMTAVGLGPGDEVVLPSHTFVASASAVVSVGAKPVFAEIGADHLLDPADAEAKITPRTRAVMPTQLNGRTADMDRISGIAREHGLLVLEDSAQGLGSLFRGRMAGTFAAAGVYSFYPAKTLGSFGDGGAVVTSDDELARTLRQLRDHGRDPETGEVVRWGRNSRLDNLQAAILKVKLKRLPEEIERRREIAARYHGNLSHVPQLVLPPPPSAPGTDDHFDVFQNYEVEAEDRDLLRTHLAEQGVGTILQWGGKGVHQFEALGIGASLPTTERMFARSLLLPMNTSLTTEEVDYVSEQIDVFYAAAHAHR